jgi:catechol 2,3-dioxygenase
LLHFVEVSSARRIRGTTGLYHFAVLLPGRPDLARVVARLISRRIPNSPTDHVMTETTYLEDPEGNGIEVYVDTPEDGTFGFEDGNFVARDADGRPRSGRDPLDLEALFSTIPRGASIEDPLPATTRIGHVHLHVAALRPAFAFYHEVLGFEDRGYGADLGMAFVSAGGYHHHIGINTWLGEGAPPPEPDSLGLRHFTLLTPTTDELAAMESRLARNHLRPVAVEGGLLISDPSGNGVLFRSAEEGSDVPG